MLPEHVLKLFEHGEIVAASIEPVSEGFRGWIGIHPYSIHPVSEMPTRVITGRPVSYRVRCFDLSNDFDLDEYDFHGDECEYRFDETCQSLEEVESLVKRVLPLPTKLDDARACDYPF